jgi:hypothetical protein
LRQQQARILFLTLKGRKEDLRRSKPKGRTRKKRRRKKGGKKTPLTELDHHLL